MKISRQGAYVYRGDQEISLPEPRIRWCKTDHKVYLSALAVRDFSGKVAHNYTVSFEAEELQKMLRVLAAAAQAQPGSVREILEVELKSLVQLAAVAAGIGGANGPAPQGPRA